MSVVVKVSRRYQVVIPREIRKAVGIREGDRVLFEVEGNEIRIRKLLIVIVEMIYVLERVYKLPKGQVKEMVESILTLPVELESFDIVVFALDLYERENPKFGDALVLATAKAKGIKPVFTFDRDFEKFQEAVVL